MAPKIPLPESEKLLADTAKSVAHRLNNALSVVLANSYISISRLDGLDGESAKKIRTCLEDIADSAASSGDLIHHFQKFLDMFSVDQSDDEFSTFLPRKQEPTSDSNSSKGDLVGRAENEPFASQSEGFAEPKTSEINTLSSKPRIIPPALHHVSILIVDDDDKVRHALSYALTLAGHHVITAASSQEALDLSRDNSYDMIFVDLKMPGMDGWELIGSIKRRAPETMVVLITGWRVQMDDERLKKNQVDAVITKPFELTEINHLLSMVVGKQG